MRSLTGISIPNIFILFDIDFYIDIDTISFRF